tara:strand:- start:13579 stop:14445 length:867 start_codon:yes stop_codon:yes gene_type:complete
MSEEQTVEAPVEAPVQASTEAPVEPAAVTLAPQQSSEPASEDWKGGLSDELRDHPSLKKYSSVENLAKGYINASSMLGKDKLVKPNNEDEWNEFYTEMGRPEGATGYKFTYEAEVPEELQAYTEGRVDAFKETAYKLGLTSEQADGLHRWYMEGNVENANSITRQVEDIQKEAENDLRQEWGNAFDQKVNHAQAALNEFGTPELVEYLESSRLGDNPHLVRTFAKIAESMMEDGSLQGLQADVKTPNQLDHDISTIMAKPEYWDPDSLERPGLIAQVQELMQQKHGTE